MDSNGRMAGELVVKALQRGITPSNNAEYQRLLAHYGADPEFRSLVGQIASGMQLRILDVSETRGMFVVPEKDSPFAIRLSDIRHQTMSPGLKAALVLVHVAIAAQFYPTTDALEDDDYTPFPASIANFRNAVQSLATRMKEGAVAYDGHKAEQLEPGWAYLCDVPPVIIEAQRTTVSSIVGIIRFVLRHLEQNGFVRSIDSESDDDSQQFTPTYRFRVQLREMSLARLFTFAQEVRTRS